MGTALKTKKAAERTEFIGAHVTVKVKLKLLEEAYERDISSSALINKLLEKALGVKYNGRR